MANIRSRLTDYLLKAGQFTAIFDSYAPTGHGRIVALLMNITDDSGDCMANHVWIYRSGQMKSLGLLPGDVITFQAKTFKYIKGETGAEYFDYSFRKIRNMEILKLSSRHFEISDSSLNLN